MLTHPTLDQLRTLKLDGMVQAFIELEAQEETHNLAHAEWLALLLDREAADRGTRRFQTRLRAARLRHSQAAYRGRRLPHAAPARQSAVPAVGHLPLDRRAPRLAGYGPMWHRQVVAILRARAEGLPRRLHRALRARAAPVRRSRSRSWGRPLRAAVPDAGQGRSPGPRRLGTRPPLGQPTARSHGDHRGPPRPRLHSHHQPTSCGNLA